MNDVDRLKSEARAAINSAEDSLIGLAAHIHANPELAFEERSAAEAIAELCAVKGFAVTPQVGGVATAVKATRGAGALHAAFCAEYDALPGIGHACGHNLIAAASVGAAIGLASVADRIGATVSVLGTPAEERGGGKIELLDAGVFDEFHLALMAHPGPMSFDYALPEVLAVAQFEIAYAGRESHASIAPHLGLNAADAMTVAQVGIGLLRQQLDPGHQIHGVVKEAGAAANVIPGAARAEYYVRAAHVDEVPALRDRVWACFEAGGVATGCSCSIEPVGKPYAEAAYDRELTALYQSNAEALGRHFENPDVPPAGSTDMGNVSQALPAIQPVFGLDCLPAFLHQPEFTPHANTKEAHRAMLEVAAALACTAIDAATIPQLRSRLLAARTRSKEGTR